MWAASEVWATADVHEQWHLQRECVNRHQRATAETEGPETMPVYFKSRFMPAGDPLRNGQIIFESAMVATGLFESNIREPEWSKVKPRLADLIPDL